MSYKTSGDLLEDAKQGILPSSDNCVPELHKYLYDLTQKYNMSMNEVARQSGISRSQLYTFISSGNPKMPSRDQLILILIVLKASFKEVQNALRYSLNMTLDPRQPRDCVFIEAFHKQLPIDEIDAKLAQLNYHTLTQK